MSMCRTSIYFSEVESVDDHLPKDALEQVPMNQSGWQLLSEATVGLAWCVGVRGGSHGWSGCHKTHSSSNSVNSLSFGGVRFPTTDQVPDGPRWLGRQRGEGGTGRPPVGCEDPCK